MRLLPPPPVRPLPRSLVAWWAGRTVEAERGSTLLEILLAGLVLVLVAGAAATGLSAAAHSSGGGRDRAMAAALAQEELERLRALSAADLANRTWTRAERVGGSTFSVRSSAAFVADATGTAACQGSLARADYVTLAVTVDWPGRKGVRPVRTRSLVAPPTGAFAAGRGSIVVQVADQAGRPAAGVPVRVGTLSLDTNAEGCALFAQLAPGPYQVRGGGGDVLPPSGTEVVRPATVQAEATTSVALELARAAAVDVSLVTDVAGERRPGLASAVTVAHSRLPAPFTRTTTSATGGPSSELAVGSLYPFTSPYGVWAGGCPAAVPAAQEPPVPVAQAVLHPAERTPVELVLPGLDAVVRREGAPVAGARVVVTSADPACAEVLEQQTAADGRVPAPGVPYGTWAVCAEADGRVVRAEGVEATAPGAVAVALPDLAQGTAGAC